MEGGSAVCTLLYVRRVRTAWHGQTNSYSDHLEFYTSLFSNDVMTTNVPAYLTTIRCPNGDSIAKAWNVSVGLSYSHSLLPFVDGITTAVTNVSTG